jgi:CHAT domain-containing protein
MKSYSSLVLEKEQILAEGFNPDFSQTNATLFYGHFFANPKDPLNGYFALACPDDSDSGKGRLPVRDLLSGEPLDQEIFIVAGCGSGRGKEIAGEGIDNLERLLLSKGVKHIVTAHWDIDQEATALFLENFIEATNEGEAVSSAFYRAQRKLIEEHPVYSHPYYWAGLRLVSKV